MDADNRPRFPLFQAEAARVWAENSTKIKRYRGSDQTSDFIRLLLRIIPLSGEVPIFRAEGFKRRADFQKRIGEILSSGGFQAGSIGLSFSRDPEVVLALAARRGPFRLLVHAERHFTAHEIAPVVAIVSPSHAAECEVAFTHGRQFRLTREPHIESDSLGDIWHFTVCEENP